jgi:drug/metabolite transporter (DMT)-like permease
MLLTVGEHSLDFMVVGTLSSILNTLGGIAIVKASSVGPLGPVNALFTSTSSTLFCVIQFLRYGKLPNALEILGMVIGIFGAFILTIPDQLRAFTQALTRPFRRSPINC